MKQSLPSFILRYQKIIFIVSALLTALLFWGALQVKTVNTLENMLPQDDPDLVTYQNFIKEFENDYTYLLVLEPQILFNADFLNTLHEITQSLQKLPHVDKVHALPQAQNMVAKDGMLSMEDLFEYPLTEETTLTFKSKALKNPFLLKYIIHPSKKLTSIFVILKPQTNSLLKQEAREQTWRDIQNILEQANKKVPFKTHFAGQATFEQALSQSTRHAQVWGTAIILIIVCVVFDFLFRSIPGVLLCLGLVGSSFVWFLGTIGFLGKPLNFVTAMLPPLILMVSVLDFIHVYSLFIHQPPNFSPQEKLAHSLNKFIKPGFLTMVTSGIGFGSLATSSMEATRHFGLFAVIGIVMAFILTVGPFSLLVMHFGSSLKTKEPASPWISKAVSLLAGLSRDHWKPVLILALLVLGITIFKIPQLTIETKPIRFYPPDSSLRQDVKLIDRSFGGTTTIDLIVKGEPGSMKNPETLKEIEIFAKETQKINYAGYPLSAIDFLKKGNRVLHDNNPDFFGIPSTTQEVETLFSFLEKDPYFKRLASPDYSTLRLNALVEAQGTQEGKQMLKEVKELAAKTLRAPLALTVTGANIVWMNMEKMIANSLITSFTTSFILITVIMALVFRSWKLGLVAMIPNVFPILVTLGIMGWMHIPLNMVTLMIASLALGLAIDDTIHLVMELKEEIHSLSLKEAIANTFKNLGPAVVSTSAVLSLSFWALCVSDFLPTYYFGLLSGVTILTGLAAELVLFPACLICFKKWIFNPPVIPATLRTK